MKAKVVETDPYAYVYRSETPKFDGITGSSAIRVEKFIRTIPKRPRVDFGK